MGLEKFVEYLNTRYDPHALRAELMAKARRTVMQGRTERLPVRVYQNLIGIEDAQIKADREPQRFGDGNRHGRRWQHRRHILIGMLCEAGARHCALRRHFEVRHPVIGYARRVYAAEIRSAQVDR